MPGSLLTPFNVGSAARVADEIRQQKKQGADFIKVGLVSPDVFFAAIADGKRVGLPVLGHLQEGVDAAQASRAGFRSIEHLGPGDSIWIGCSTNDAALLAEAAQHPAMKALPMRIPAFVEKILMKRLQNRLINPAAFDNAADIARLQRAFDTYSEAKCRQLATIVVANHTWNVPTLVRLRTQELADSPEYLSDPALPYIPAESVKAWREVTDKFHKLPAAMHSTYREAYQRQLALTKLRRCGRSNDRAFETFLSDILGCFPAFCPSINRPTCRQFESRQPATVENDHSDSASTSAWAHLFSEG